MMLVFPDLFQFSNHRFGSRLRRRFRRRFRRWFWRVLMHTLFTQSEGNILVVTLNGLYRYGGILYFKYFVSILGQYIVTIYSSLEQ